MGAFFDSIHARTEDIAAVQKTLEQVTMRCDAKFLLGPALNGWISILPGGSGPDESLSQEIAKTLACDVFHLAVHDDDVFMYFFFRGGKLVDQYNSCPDYFDGATDAEIEKSQGCPELFQDLLPDPASLKKLKELLAADRFTFEAQRMSEFSELFGLSNAATSYDYARSGDDDQIEGWEKFVHLEYQPRSAEDYNKRGEARLTKKDLENALADFEKALELDPNFAAARENCSRVELARNEQNTWMSDAYNRAGLERRDVGELDEALLYFDKALLVNPNNASAYSNRGLTRKEKGNRDGALADLNKAIELDRGLSAAYLNRAGVNRDNGNFHDALADYDKAIELKPDSARAYNKRGKLKWKKGDADGALADFNKSIELNPKLSAAYVNRGDVKRDGGNVDEALADYNRAIELEPDSATAHNNRGELKRKMDDVDGALADYNRALELKPNTAAYYSNRSLAKLRKRDLEGAMADSNRAIELKPDLAIPYNNRGMIKQVKGDLDGALTDYERAIRLNPNAEAFRMNRDKLLQIKKGDG